MEPSGLERRAFLVGSAASIAAGSLLGCFPAGSPLADLAVARQLGARFADRYPDAAARLWRGDPPDDDTAWAPRLAMLRREDFEADRLVQVDGWWLAESEILLCVVLHARG